MLLGVVVRVRSARRVFHAGVFLCEPKIAVAVVVNVVWVNYGDLFAIVYVEF